VGAFVQSTYNVTDTWRVTGGLRYDDSKVTMAEQYSSNSIATGQLLTGSLPNANESGIRKFKNSTFKLRVEHDLTAQNLLYASVSSGFSPGDVSIAQDSQNQPYVLELKDETLISYEIGTKNRFLGNTLQLNAALYFNDYGAYQSAGTNLTPTAITPSLGTVASPAQVLGGELETVYQLTPADRINLNLAYTDARFVDKAGTVINVGATQKTFADFFARDEIPGVVPFSANLSYEHTFTLPGNSTLRARVAARYLAGHDLANLTPAQLATSAAFARVDSQVVGDANVSWATANGNWSVTGYVRNFNDNQYKNQAFLQTGLWVTTPYDPRTTGIVLSARF
jgi:iron complex outermembrane receptor protein